jgi:predicted amidohydrolase YtcJ
MGSAHACGREKELGSIAPGKFADLVALDRDIFSIEPMEIASSRVVMTIFDGQIVFEE